ncbi:MAG: hypothetical protein GEU28_12900 [Dehalococcoidia bacterium]|nr:hypothetical protein [Dehalococcoidia bacterium]
MVTAAQTGRMQGQAVQPVLPAPSFNSAGDLVFISSIFPLDPSGNVVQADSISPYIGQSEMGAQARSVMEILKQVLADAGTSLERMLKAEVYLKDPEDFYEFKLVWKEFFPNDPPSAPPPASARTTSSPASSSTSTASPSPATPPGGARSSTSTMSPTPWRPSGSHRRSRPAPSSSRPTSLPPTSRPASPSARCPSTPTTAPTPRCRPTTSSRTWRRC